MAFGRYMQNSRMRGYDEGDIEKAAAESMEGAIVIESLVNIRVIAALSMERERVRTYTSALLGKDKNNLCENTIMGTAQGLGSFFQMWGKCHKENQSSSADLRLDDDNPNKLLHSFLVCLIGYALMFYFGSWVLLHRDYEMRDLLISLFGLMLSLTGLSAAMAGLTDSEKAKEAAGRIFELMERESDIDPLSGKGKIQEPKKEESWKWEVFPYENQSTMGRSYDIVIIFIVVYGNTFGPFDDGGL